jgi:beta-N-acetylhexosaminidase
MTDGTVGMNDSLESPEALERIAAGLLMIGFPGQSVPPDTVNLITRGVRSFILFARNIGEAEQVKSLNAQLRALAGDDALIAIDHEGGRVNRLGGAVTPWPNPMAWAATGDIDLVRRASTAAAQELGVLGFNLNFAPVADVLGNHHNPVLGARCFSDNPQTVAEYASAFIEGHRCSNIAATAKHFPGHGSTSVDSHVDLPEVGLTLDELQCSDLVPFKAAIAADVDCLMVSHIWYSMLDDRSTPATVSRRVMDLARGELGYDGVIVTDSMEMKAIQNHMAIGEAVVQAIGAGADLAIVSHPIERQQEALEALIAAVRDGTLPIARLMEASRRLASLRKRVQSTGTTRPENGEELARSIARQSITLVRDEAGFIPLHLAANETLGVVTFSLQRPTGVENARTPPSGLPDMARRHHAHVLEVQVEDVEPDAVLDGLCAADTIMVGTSFTTGHPRQGDVVNTLLRSGKRVVVLALSDPFDLLSFPEAPCYLAVYGDTSHQLDAALAVLFGDSHAHGRLPVRLGDLHPRGHGIQRDGGQNPRTHQMRG